MRKLLVSFVALLAATVASAQTPGSAGQGFVEMKASGTPGKATATRQARLTATVKAIDVAARKVTLQNQAGDTQTIKVGPTVQRLGEVAVGDTIEVEVEQDLALELQSSGSPTVPPMALTMGDRAGPGEAPGGVVAAGIQATVTVTAIDSGNRMVVFQGPGGNLYQVKAGPEVKLEKLKVGDRLLATYVEAVAIKLEKPAKK
jgi:Cu/Ag efflux protein CusF